MSNDRIIRAWKDPEFRSRLDAAEAGALPPHPIGAVEIDDDDLDGAGGGTTTITTTVIATEAMSCWPACSHTMWKGTCAVASVGCCGGGGEELQVMHAI